jgi:hypothetical protein
VSDDLYLDRPCVHSNENDDCGALCDHCKHRCYEHPVGFGERFGSDTAPKCAILWCPCPGFFDELLSR